MNKTDERDITPETESDTNIELLAPEPQPATPAKPMTLTSIVRRTGRPVVEPADPVADAAPPADRAGHLALLQGELALTRDRRKGARLHHEIGRLEERRGNGREALLHYQEAYRLDPGFVPNLRALRRLFRVRGNWNWVVQLLDAELRVRAEREERTALLLEKANVLEARLHNFPRAAGAFEEVLRLDATEPLALRGIERIRARSGNKDAALAAGLQLAESLGDGAEKSALLQELAALDESSRGALLGRAVTAAPRNLGAVRALGAIHQSAGRWQDLVSVLSYLAEARSPSTDAARLRLRAARIAGTKLDMRDAARAQVSAALESAPMDLDVHREAIALLGELGLWEDLAQHAEQAIFLARQPADLARLHRDVAEVYVARLHDDEAAIRHYEAALEIHPTDAPTARALARLYIERERWRETARLYVNEAAATTDTPRKAAMLFKVAEIAERRVGDADAATARCREALTVEPGYQPALDALARLAEARGDVEELVTVLERRLVMTSDPGEAALLLVRIGGVRATQAGRTGEAVAAYRRALERAPEDRHLARLALRGIRRLAAATGDVAENARATADEAALPQAPERALGLWALAGDLFEQSGDFDRAEDCYRRGLGIDATDAGCLSALGNLLREQGRASDLVAVCRRQMEATRDPVRRRALLFDIAELARDRLGDPRAAAEALTAVCQDAARAPADPVASRALATLRNEAGDHAGFAEILRYEAMQARDPHAAAAFLTLAGLAWEGPLGKPEHAAELYRQARERNPGDAAAGRALMTLLRRKPDWTALLALLGERAAAGTRAEKLLALAETAEVLELRVKDADAAAAAWRALREVEPDSPFAVRALSVELLRHDPFAAGHAQGSRGAAARAELAALWKRRAAQVEDQRLAFALCTDLGALGDCMGDQRAAVAQYEKALEYAPRSRATLRVLEELAERAGDVTLGVRALRAQADMELDPRLRAAFLRRVARLEMAAGEAGAARAALREGLRAVPDDLPTLKDLRRLAQTGAAPLGDEFCRAAEAEAAATVEREVAVRRWLEAAGVWQEKLLDEERAADDYRAVLERDALHRGSFVRLGRILYRRGDWARLERLLSARLQASPAPPEQAELAFHAAELRRDRLHDPGAAEEALLRGLRIEPGSRYALWALGELAVTRGGWDEAARAFERALAEEKPLGAQLRLRLRLAAVYADKLDDVAKAIPHLEEVVAADRTYLPALERLGALYVRAERWDAAKVVTEMAVHLATDDATFISLQLRLGDVLQRGLKDPRGAVTACRTALQRDPVSAAANHRMRDLLLTQGDARALAGFYEGGMERMRERIDHAPFELEAHARLRELFAWSKRPDHEWVACGVAVALGNADEEARAVLSRHEARRRALPTAPVDDALFDTEVTHPRARRAVRRLFRALSPLLAKMVPDALARLSVRREERVRGGEIYDEAAQLARVAGVPDFELYVSEEHPRAAAGVLSAPPGLVVGAALAEPQHPAHRRFALARALVEVRDAHPRARLMTAPALLEMLRAMVVAFEPEGAANMGFGGETDLARRLRKLPSRRERELFEELARTAILEGPPADPAAWLPHLADTANRFALACSNDVAGALDALARILGAATIVEGAALAAAADHPEAREALAFCVSESHFRLRRAVGLPLAPAPS
ncbi:MAG TPA: hypothetical protein VG389_14850 [Myxococcota bacterium]|nr:hypothetical protein [Myxococcota bacterium]